jgi:uncharacterized protein (DUF2147 family)
MEPRNARFYQPVSAGKKQHTAKTVREVAMKHAHPIKDIGIALLFALAGASAAHAAAEDAIGTWRDTETGGILSVYTCPGGICVKVVTPGKGRETDPNNPDPALKGRSLAGVDLMTGAAKDGADRWKGNLYNSEDGKTYSGYLVVSGKDELKLEGCVLAGLICKSHVWKRQQ